MSKSDTPTQNDVGTTASIEGPIPETNKYGERTGYEYYACAGCGVEAMYEADVREHCRCGGVN